MAIEIKKLLSNNLDEFTALINVFKHIFEWENLSLPNRMHLQRVLANPHLIVLIAKTDQKVVGGLTAHVLDRYDSEKPLVYVYDLAVLPDLQRKGIGRQLMTALLDYGATNGFKEVFVQTETDDWQAVNFYRSTPISSELQATHFTYSFSKTYSDNGEMGRT